MSSLAYFCSVKYVKLNIKGGLVTVDSMFLSLLAILPESIPGCSNYYSQEGSYGLDASGGTIFLLEEKEGYSGNLLDDLICCPLFI